MTSSTRLIASTVAGGVVLGTWYALSPLTVWFVVVLAALGRAAVHGLPADERRRVVVILAVAVSLRLLALAVLFLGSDHGRATSFFWDGDGVYLKLRGLWIRNVWLGLPVSPTDLADAFQPYGWTTYLYVIAYLQYLVGPSPYGIHLLNVAIFVATATLLYRLARSAFGPWAAVLGLALLLFLPTPFLWSISALKESLYVFLETCAIVAAIAMVRTEGWALKLAAFTLLVAAFEVNGTVRAGALAIGALGLTIGLLGGAAARRLSVAVLLVALLPLVSYLALRRDDVQARLASQLATSAEMHLGNVRTEGHGYKLLDQRFYGGAYDARYVTMTPMESARFVTRAAISFVLVPLPWQMESLQEIVFLPQQVAWYLMALLALVGVCAGLRRDALVTCLLAGFTVAGGAAVALNSGNIGTMVRHRDTIVPFVVWLSAFGLVQVVSSVARVSAAPGLPGLDIETNPYASS